jgi:cytochrome c oxidase subunit 2
MLTSRVKRIAAMAGLAAVSPTALADYALNFQPPVTEIASTVFDLHMAILWICVAIGVVVFGAMIISIVLHRKSRGVQPAQFHESTTVEIIWTVIPLLILVSMAIPATTTLIQMEKAPKSEVTIKITASQFKWQYDYLNEDFGFISALATPEDQIKGVAPKGENYLLEVDNPVVIPVGVPVRFLLTAADVLHAWWVPAISVKKDAVPGFINEMWTKVDKPGTYRGQCAELCGPKHGFMPIVLEAKSPEDYQKWVAEKQAAKAAEVAAMESGKTWTKEEMMAKGEKVYAANCAVCHQATGLGMPPTFPALKGSKVATGAVEEHIGLVLKGKNAMPPFGAALNDMDLAAVITYERNAWDNNTGSVVQPADVKKLR